MLTLYHCNTSYASHKARLYLAEKGIPWDSVHIDLRKQEHLTSDYRTINPNGTVPTLKDEQGNFHCGSTEIMFFLEKTYRQPALLPHDVTHRNMIHQFCKDHEALHDPFLRTLSYHLLFMNPNKRKTLNIDNIIQLAKNHPNPKRGKFLHQAITRGFSQKDLNQCKQEINKSLSNMQRLLRNNMPGYLYNNQYTIADSVATATLFRLEVIDMLDVIKKNALLNAYYTAMQQRASFKIAILDLWV